MTIMKQQWEFLKDVAKLIQYAESIGFVLTGGELYRTIEQQKIYMETGKSKTMKSSHLDRLAIDFNFFIDNNLTYAKEVVKPLADYWKSLSPQNGWGGDFANFVDTPHFERRLL